MERSRRIGKRHWVLLYAAEWPHLRCGPFGLLFWPFVDSFAHVEWVRGQTESTVRLRSWLRCSLLSGCSGVLSLLVKKWSRCCLAIFCSGSMSDSISSWLLGFPNTGGFGWFFKFLLLFWEILPLDLGYNSIGAEGASKNTSWTNLTTLNLSSNLIGDQGASAISWVHKNSSKDLQKMRGGNYLNESIHRLDWFTSNYQFS